MYAYIYIHKYASSKHLDKFIVTPGRVQTEMVKQPMAWKLVSSWNDLCNQDTVNYSVDPFSHNKRLGAKKKTEIRFSSKISNSSEIIFVLREGTSLFL